MANQLADVDPNPTLPIAGISRQRSDIELELTSQWGMGTENESMLPPVDGGKDAWMCLAAAFMVDILVWGFPWSFGIFQEYYSTHAPFAGSPNIAVVGTCALGVLYMAAPFTFGTLLRYPWWRKTAFVAGLLTMCLSIGLSSLCKTVPQLIMTQGILFGAGGAITYSPAIQFMDEWFVARKGLAFGLMWAGTALGGVLIPLLLQVLLNHYGHRITLLFWALILLVCTFPLMFLMKPRLPVPSAGARAPRQLSLSFLKDRTFIVLQVCSVLESIGYFIPSIYLPTLATQYLKGTSIVAVSTIVVFNVAAVFGGIAMGTIIDKWNLSTGISLSTLGAVVSVFFIWGFSTSLPTLFAFSVLYGLFAGSFTNTWPGIIRMVSRRMGQVESNMMVFAFLSLGRGVGNVLCGPLSEALMGVDYVGAKGLYGTKYGSLVVFTGVSAALGGMSIVGKSIGWLESF